jgi:hypothetical protein
MAEAVLIPEQVQKDIKAYATIKLSIHNRFDVEVIDAATGRTKKRAYAENVICNQLWSRIFAQNPWNAYIHYGSGTGTPSESDTSLFNFVGSAANTGVVRNFNTANGVAYIRHQIQLSETTAVGVTLTEVGIGYSASASSLCTHAMLRDMNGNQISILKTDTDIINIFATVFVHYNPEGYDDGSIHLTPYYENSTSNCALIEWLFGADGTPHNGKLSYSRSGHGMDVTSANDTFTVTPNLTEKSIKLKASRKSVSNWNASGGIGSVSLCSSYQMNINFKVGGSWYPGTSIVGEAIGTGDVVTKDFKTSFGYATDATVYVDGVPASDVVVDDSPYSTNQVGLYFERLDENKRLTSAYWNPGSNGTIYSNAVFNVFNPNYAWGIVSFTKASSTKVEVSDDFETWVEILTGQSGTVTVPTEYRNAKYWRFTATHSSGDQNLRNFVSGAPTNNIHFETPPPPGAVITADYFTKTIAKDSNHASILNAPS